MKKPLISVAIALVLVASNSVMAQHGHGHGRMDHGSHHARDVRGPHQDERPQLRSDRSGPARHAARPARFHKGDRVAPQFRNRHYVVNDWRGRRLRQPPRGHQWVQVGAEYALVAIASGIVIDIVFNR